MSDPLSRREFLGRTGAATAGLAAAAYAPAARAQNANSRVRLGLMGCGGRGTGNLLLMLGMGADCVALADPDDRMSGQTLDKVVAAGGPKPAVYRDFRKMLDRKDIDAVLVSTPDHWHALGSIHACMAGKDVFVEKPVSHNIREGRAMVDAARKYDRVVFVGTQQRSALHFNHARDYLRSGRLGRICMVKTWVTCHDSGLGRPADGTPPAHCDYDLWLGPAPKRPFNPNRFHYQWRWFWDYAGGKSADWGIHMIDIVHWMLDVKAPTSVASTGGKFILDDNTETPDTQVAIFDYPGFSCTWEQRQGNARAVEHRPHGIAIYGENGTLAISRTEWAVYSEDNRIEKPPQAQGERDEEMFVRHARHFLDCLRSRQRGNADIEDGHRSTSACQLANIAFRVGRRIQWDPEKEEIIGDRDAARLLTREYREPWSLPKI